MTALTINGSAVAATTLTAAGKLFNATGGTSGSTSTKVGTATGRKQIFAKGTTTSQSGAGSIPAPTDANFNGWLWDVTTLEGQELAAGTWTPTIHLLASTGTTVTPTVEWYKRSSSGVYTQIGTVTGSSIALTTSAQLLVFTAPSLALMDFATGDKLCMWLWVNQTAGGATNSTISVVEATSGSSAGVASEAQAVTPGYGPVPVALSGTLVGKGTLTGTIPSLYAQTVLADSPLRYYRVDESSGTVARDNGSQGQDGTYTGGVTLAQTGLLVSDPDSAALFDGSTGFIATANGASVGGLAALSVEYWVKFTALSDYYRIVSSDDTQNSHVGFDAYIDAPSQSANIIIGNGTAAVFGWQTPTLSIGTRYHIVFTYDGANIRTYLNGALVGSPVAQTGTIGTPLGAITLGRNGTVAFGYLPGVIDEVAVYGSALSAARVMTHYLAGAWTATLAGVGTLAGTLSAASGAGALAGECDGVGTLAGTLSFATALSDTLAGAGTLQATLALATALAGTCAGAGALTGTPTFSTALAVTLPGIGQLAGQPGAARALPALTLIGVGTLTGAPALATALSTPLAGVGVLSASVPALSTALSVQLAGTGTIVETLSLATQLAATCTGVGQLAGAPALRVALATTLSGVGTLSGSLAAGGNVALAGTLAGVGTLAGTAQLATALTGTLAGVGMLTGTLAARGALSSTQPGQGALVGALSLATALVGTCPGTGTLTGVFSLRVALSCAFMGMGILSGTLSIPGAALYLTATWVTRDLQATWKTRDENAAWVTRDEQDTWKTRG